MLSNGQKKVVLFPESVGWKNFYHSPAHIIECVSQYVFLIKKKQQQKNKYLRRQEAKKLKKGISVENLTGYDNIFCEFALCTLNLLDRVVNFPWLLIWI